MPLSGRTSAASASIASSGSSTAKKLRIGFVHPDLGIGGAEKLVVDAALSLQNLGHEITIFTSHHDPSHCFEPTRDGTLKVQVMKTCVPRSVGGRFHLPCAILQQLSLVVQLIVAILLFHIGVPKTISQWLTSSPPIPGFDLFFFDQLPAGIPILKMLLATRVVYYCHFPDKDISISLAVQKAKTQGKAGPSLLRMAYRLPFDMFEEVTTDFADKILVNSEFTAQQFVRSFRRLARLPRTVYPGVELSQFEPTQVGKKVQQLQTTVTSLGDPIQTAITQFCQDKDRTTLLSVNRFEAKKNVALALESFAVAQKEYEATETANSAKSKMRLVLVGGYDRRVDDNIKTLKRLQEQCREMGLKYLTLSYMRQAYEPPVSPPSSEEMASASVVFLLSLPMPLIHTLLLNDSSKALLYTPTEEHFGIVPLEAMACGLPVLSTNTGGPVETVVDLGLDETGTPTNTETGTGLLRDPQVSSWATAIAALLQLSPTNRTRISKAAQDRVKARFSTDVMSKALERACYDAYALGPVRGSEGLYQWCFTLFFSVATITFFFVATALADDPSRMPESRLAAAPK